MGCVGRKINEDFVVVVVVVIVVAVDVAVFFMIAL